MNHSLQAKKSAKKLSSSLSKTPIITLDGPSGTGKGTLCHRLALLLGWHFLDSGVLYRLVALLARNKQVDFSDIPALVRIAFEINLTDQDTYQHALRTEQCGQDASKIAVIPEIRAALLEKQRSFAVLPGLVTDGRDMGTVVFPDADLKIFLTASTEERAKRRFLQLKRSGINANLAQVVEELAERDLRDSSRNNAPLKAASDAVYIDTTELTIDQVLEIVVNYVRSVWGEVFTS